MGRSFKLDHIPATDSSRPLLSPRLGPSYPQDLHGSHSMTPFSSDVEGRMGFVQSYGGLSILLEIASSDVSTTISLGTNVLNVRISLPPRIAAQFLFEHT
ncbi:unnamed protein product [Cyclocybe aegerita]|uniref:Uncharacterized protein n=1 Tax=Cyclocybe aegerita TaxID=1973307 RepID=A0A8S0VUP6_CYCAE|nr:unnamed protein product [Cyclocybe aegerita]